MGVNNKQLAAFIMEMECKMLGDIWLIRSRFLYRTRHILETFLSFRDHERCKAEPKVNFLLQLEIVNCGVSRHTAKKEPFVCYCKNVIIPLLEELSVGLSKPVDKAHRYFGKYIYGQSL